MGSRAPGYRLRASGFGRRAWRARNPVLARLILPARLSGGRSVPIIRRKVQAPACGIAEIAEPVSHRHPRQKPEVRSTSPKSEAWSRKP